MGSIFRRGHVVLMGQPVELQTQDVVRLAMLAALPVAVLVGSPQRVELSAVIAAAYVVAAAVTIRGSRANRLVIAYVAAAAAWMVASWLRSRYLLHLDAGQLDYATSKAIYFVSIVLPMSAAVTMMIDRAADLWPTLTTQVAIGVAVALLTIVFLDARFLGADRYAWQGNLIALGTVVAIQPWPFRSIKASAVIGLLGVAGIMFADSRQSLAAVVVAMLLSTIYWAAAAYLSEKGGLWSRLKTSPAGPYAVLPLVLVIIAGAYVAVTYARDVAVRVDSGGVHWTGPSSLCNCVTDRIASLQTSAGDRDKLLARGVKLFVQSPLLGTGLGSFSGVVPDSSKQGDFYQYPHDVPLEIAAETGLVGLAIMILPLVVSWALLMWNGINRMSAPVAAVLMVVAVFFTVANISGDIPSDRGLWIFGIVALKLGIDAWQRRAEQPGVPRGRFDAPALIS